MAGQSPGSAPGLVVAFDLDMTLIDSAPGVADTLTVLGQELGLDLPIEHVTTSLGPPIHVLLADHVPAEDMDGFVDRFRELYADHAIHGVEALDGAVAAIAAVRRHGGRVVVVTGKYEPNARRHVDHLELVVDHVAGTVVGVGKADALAALSASILVGDHVHDVEGARAAGVLSVSVLTGGSSEAELRAAGTDVVLADLTEFPAWLDSHLAG
jgi:phosphoglycolate phosphatase-like HAD superfamily hydrolase